MSTSEWKRNGPSTLQRRLRGAELLINYSEQYNEGNYQLAFSALIQSNLSSRDLEERFHAAWFFVRKIHPVIGLELVSPGKRLDFATFNGLTTKQEATEWAEDTCFLVKDGRSVEDVEFACKQHPIISPGKRANVHLVIDPRIGPSGFVLHSSHVLSGHHALKILETIGEQLANDASSQGLQRAFQCEDLDELLPRLPKSAITAYEEELKPTSRDIEHAWATQANAAERYTKNTLGIPFHEDWQTRQSRMQNLFFEIDEEDFRNIMRTLKSNRLTITSAFFACICSSMAHMYYNEKVDGAHLLFSAHAKRWLSTEGEKGTAPVTMAIVPGGAWIDATEDELKANTAESLMKLARKIAKAQEVDLVSPHIMATFDKIAINATQAPPQAGSSSAQATFGRPTFTSQGFISVRRDYDGGHKNSKTWLKIIGGRYGGRNTDPVV
ncbi:hypothetical protein CBS101457_005264 [Exobasidium rhododendri]|nr:hypothetical protein CBS101457_005264 [Exobasidium rhododendri]